MDKEKQIEEMEKILKEEQIRIANTVEGFKDLMEKGVTYCHSKVLINANYRKINDNEVVVSKEEKQKLLKEMYEQGKFDAIADLEKDGKVVLSKESYEDLIESKRQLGCYIEDQKIWIDAANGARKETAEKILKPLYDACKDDSYGQVVVDFSILESFAKEFGVEIKE